MLATLLAFVGISAVVIATPGPDTAVTVRNTLLGGRAAGIATAFGVAAGQAIWALCTSLGIVALLIASEPLFLAVKYAGAAYLVGLGLQTLWSAWRTEATHGKSARAGGRPLPPRAAFRQGVVSDLGNPKMAVFFASLLPQFVPADVEPFATLLALGLVFSLMTLAWLAAYAVVVAKAGNVLRQPAMRRSIEGITGSILVALGLSLATEGRQP